MSSEREPTVPPKPTPPKVTYTEGEWYGPDHDSIKKIHAKRLNEHSQQMQHWREQKSKHLEWERENTDKWQMQGSGSALPNKNEPTWVDCNGRIRGIYD